MSVFSERLIALMKQNRINQKELAQKAGVTESAMSYYVKGDRTPRSDVLTRIAKALETTTDYLLGTSESVSEVPRGELQYLQRNLGKLDSDQLKKTENILKAAFNEILVKSSAIQTFPFSPKDLVKEQTPIVCRSFKKARKYGVDITAFGSESAIIMSFKGKKIIFYDETKPDTHNRFSILHELGHEINGHDFSKKDEDAYHRYEVETNYFAAQLLMPEQILRECQNRGARINRFFLQTNFGVSAQAEDKRIETLARTNVEWRSKAEKEFDDIILIKYADFLNRICPVRNTYDFEDEYIRQQERNSCF